MVGLVAKKVILENVFGEKGGFGSTLNQKV